MYLDARLLHIISSTCYSLQKTIEDLNTSDLLKKINQINKKFSSRDMKLKRNVKSLKVIDVLIETRKISKNGIINFEDFLHSWHFMADNAFEYYISNVRKGEATEQEIEEFKSLVMNKQTYDPLYGRQKEIDDLAAILSRKKKNSAVLVGKAGTGKTSIIQEFVQRVEANEYPKLSGYKIIQMDSSMVKMMMQIPTEVFRLSYLINIASAKNIILFFDEIHTLCGDQRGTVQSIIDKFKPGMAEGNLQILGTTTPEEYKRDMEYDGALTRRLQYIKVKEMSKDDTLNTIKLLAPIYKRYHQCSIENENKVMELIVDLSERYIYNKAEPDRSLDIIDEALSYATNTKRIGTTVGEIALLELIARGETNEALKLINISNGKKPIPSKNIIVTIKDIKEAIARKAKIPVDLLDQTDTDRIYKLEEVFKAKLIGQEKATTSFVSAVKRIKAGLSNPDKPASIMLAGPSGVGKTYLAKIASDILFDGKKDAFVRLDMSEFVSRFTVSSLIGSPPGYVDSQKGGRLTEAVYNNPYCIILLDEIEKAHDDVINILLQILDEGKLTDAMGKSVNFKNVILIMTTNQGMETVKVNNKRIGFQEVDSHNISTTVMMAGLKDRFKPEFLNRIDEICTFNYLQEENVRKIIDLEIKEALKRIDKPVTIKDTTIQKIIDEFYDIEYGARSLKRGVETLIITKLSEEIIKNPNKKKYEV